MIEPVQRDQQILELIDCIYAAAIQPQHWANFLEKVSFVVHGEALTTLRACVENSMSLPSADRAALDLPQQHEQERTGDDGDDNLGTRGLVRDGSNARILRVLIPHLWRALEFQRRLEALAEQVTLSEQALDRLTVGFLLAGRRDQILEMNIEQPKPSWFAATAFA